MIFQILDEKKECLLLFYNGNFHNKVSSDYKYTWKYYSILKNRKDVEYAFLYANGKNVDEICPKRIKRQWQTIKRQFKAYFRAAKITKIDLNNCCLCDIVPLWFLKDFCEIKEKIIEHTINNYSKPYNYDFLCELHKLSTQIEHQKLNINKENIQIDSKNSLLYKKYKRIDFMPRYISYNIFGTKIGGLTTKKVSFPILNLDKRLRGVLMPNNDVFLEIDYNAAHLRVMLELCGHQQPKEDIHEWNRKEFFKNDMSRDEIKKNTFAWLYNETAKSPLSQFYNKEKVLDKYYANGKIKNIYKREIECDEHYALNYILASTAQDMFLRKAIEIGKLLNNKKTQITALIQDSILIDLSISEWFLINDIVQIFSQVNFPDLKNDVFKVNVCLGKNFGEMKKINV